MCVIVVKNKGVAMPTMDNLKACFEHNPDGAGFMYTSGDGYVHIRKGFMKWKDFKSAIEKLEQKIDITQEAVVMHFRISTQAGVNKKCCHPYPLSKNMKDLRSTNIRSKIGVAHNGIIELTSEYDYWTNSKWGNSKKKIDYNDTMKFITDYLALIIKGDKYYKDADTLALIERLCGSKLAIMDASGHVQLVGKFEKVGDIYYSNLNHEKVIDNSYTRYIRTDRNYDYTCGSEFSRFGDYGYEEKDDDDDTTEYYSIPIKNAYEFDKETYIMDDTRAYINDYYAEYYNYYEVDCHNLDGEPYVAYFSYENKEVQLEAIVPFDYN